MTRKHRNDTDLEPCYKTMAIIRDNPGITRGELSRLLDVPYTRIKRILDISELLDGYAVGITQPRPEAHWRSQIGYYMLRFEGKYFGPM